MKDEVVVGEIFKIDISDKIQEVYPKLMDLEVTPSKEQQIFNHEGEYGYDNVTVDAVTSSIDENIKSENIKNGINILGIEGTLKPAKPEQTKTIISSKEEQMVVPDEGFELSKVIVKPIPLQVKEVVPSTEAIEVVPDEQNFVLEKVVVLPAPLEIKETKSKPSEIVEVIPEGENIGLKKVIVNPIILSNKTIVPTKELQKVEPDINTDGLSYVNIEPIPNEYIIPSGEIDIKTNGRYNVTELSSVNVNTPVPSGTMQITENNTYNVKDVEFAEVNVYQPLQEKTKAITENGTTIFEADNGYYGLSRVQVDVNIPEKKLGTKTITENGTYNATNDNLDGYSQVNVTTSGVDINDYFETTYSGTAPNSWVNNNFVKKVPDLVIADSVTSLEQFCADCGYAPKIICNSNINNMLRMYYYNKSSNIDTRGLNTSAVTNMARMFDNCSSLTSLDLSNFNTSKVTNMSNMFCNCYSLTSLDLSNFDTSKVTDMEGMFYYCSKLTNLDIRNFDFTNVTSYSNTFRRIPANCLIIVKDDTAKTWITSKFTYLTNVKTVAELGGIT